jgi:hypothetical protein
MINYLIIFFFFFFFFLFLLFFFFFFSFLYLLFFFSFILFERALGGRLGAALRSGELDPADVAAAVVADVLGSPPAAGRAS